MDEDTLYYELTDAEGSWDTPCEGSKDDLVQWVNFWRRRGVRARKSRPLVVSPDGDTIFLSENS